MATPTFEEDWRFVFAKTGKPKEHGLSPGKRRPTNAGMRRAVISATQRKPNVVVKITGFSKAAGDGLKPHLDYISRHGKNEVFDHTGTSFNEIADRLGIDKRDALDRYGEELANPIQLEKPRGRPRERTAMHLMLSMPPGGDKASFELGVRSFLQEVFHEHDHVFTFHDDTAYYHAHVVVGLQGHDGQWLNPRKHHLQEWREDYAAAMERHGIAAKAAPAYSLGEPPKNKPRAIEQMNRRDQRDGTTTRRRSEVAPTYDAEAEAGAIERRADAWERIARHYESTGDKEAAGAVREHLAEHFSRHGARESDHTR